MKRIILPILGLWLAGGCTANGAKPDDEQRDALLPAGCACPSEAEPISLECFRAELPGSSPSYDEVRQWSSPGAHWGGCFDDSRWWVTEQTGCGKLVVAMAPVIGGWTYVYDEATHELIGAQIANDEPFGPCGTGSYSAGESPRCDEGTVCSLCDASGNTCAANCSLELLDQTRGLPRYEDEISGYDCSVLEPGRRLPEVHSGCGRIKVVTAYDTVTYSADTHALLAVENGSIECGGSWGDPGAVCADETSCSLCDNSPNRCPR